MAMSQNLILSMLPRASVFKLALVWMIVHIQAAALAQGVLGASPETNQPVHVSQGATPLVMLTLARDHSLFFGAYNDLTDLDGSGTINFNFVPTFEYIGLFNSSYCYAYNGRTDSTNILPAGVDSYFKPVGNANPLVSAQTYPGGCTTGASVGNWSGNWLNYVTTSRIDAMRVALYGGHRIKDGIATDARPITLLRRAYIPQDGHTWAKEYTSAAVNFYDISKYTPFSAPSNDANGVPRRHFFGNLTSTVIRDVTASGAPNPAGIQHNTSAVQITGINPATGIRGISTDNPDLGKACDTLNTCSNYPPVMRVVLNAGSRVWRWAASQRPVLDYHPYPIGYSPDTFIYPNKGNFEGYGNLYDDLAHYVSPQPSYPVDYTVQVEVCASGFLNGCKQYGTSSPYSYKPVGILHDYGENDSLKFGLITGSYDSNLSGGRLRKNIGTFTDEVDAATGRFKYKYSNMSLTGSLIEQIDNLRIRNFNNPTVTPPRPVPNYDAYFSNSFIYKNTYKAVFDNATGYVNGDGLEGDFGDWGNPIGEMMYEGLRYFAGAGSASPGGTQRGPTPSYVSGGTTDDGVVGLSNPSWNNPYQDASNWCAKPNLLVVSGPYISSDSDQLPGSRFGTFTETTLQNTAGATLNVGALTDSIGDVEAINGTAKFIGEVVGTPKDFSPTIKTIDQLGNARGQAPNNPEAQGSFYSAGVAYFGKSGSLQSVGGQNIPSVDTYSILLPNPNATIKVPFPDGRVVSVVPFAKTVGENNGTKGEYQTTNQFVGIYVTESTITPTTYSLKFYVNFEDHSAGGDFEMDAVAYYQINADANSITITVEDNANDAAGGQNMGYVISGTNHDGAYLVVQDRPSGADRSYYLNVPSGGSYWAGYCDPSGPYGNNTAQPRCMVLPNKGAGTRSIKTFGLAAAGGATPVLKHPLWYAARWGGYDGTSAPTAPLPDGQNPSHYIELTSPAGLKTAFYKMFQDVLDHSSTVGTVTSMSKELDTSSRIFTTSFNSRTLFGELTASKISVVPATPSDSVSFPVDWKVSERMPSYSARNIFYKTPLDGSSTLLVFNYDNLNSASTGYPGAFASRDIVDYLRGDTSKEVQYGGVFRNRQSVMGTTINSTPIYSPDTNMVYVGANDGMLHAFDAETGAEKFAFIPSSIVKKTGGGAGTLSWLANQDSRHRFYMDGNLEITDKYASDSTMTPGYNYLVGFLGRGGKGLFGLPVNSTSIKTDGGVWEIDGTGDNHMGYLLGKPLIERLNDGTNVVIFGNGYNSTYNQAALYVVRVSDGHVLARFLTCAGGTAVGACGGGAPNGLATPAALRRDGRVQQVYAGDYLGNVWKFDLSELQGTDSATDYSGTPKVKNIFTATTSSGAMQHIVAPVTTSYSSDSADTNTQNKQYVFFGTGSDLTVADLSTTSTVQTMYGLIDDPTTRPSRATNMRQRSINSNGNFDGYKTGATLSVRSFTAPGNDMRDQLGWYMDWSTPSVLGGAPVEQVFTEATLRSSVTPTLVVSSAIASSASCVSNGAGYLNAMDAYHGGSLSVSYFDINRDGKRNETFGTAGNLQQISSIDFAIGEIGKAGFSGANVIVQGSGPSTGGVPNTADVGLLGSTDVSRRTSWREINN